MKKPTTIAIALTALGFSFSHAVDAAPKPPAAKDWVIESQADWEANTDSQSGFEFKDGMAVPTAPSATIRSKIKAFD